MKVSAQLSDGRNELAGSHLRYNPGELGECSE